MEGNITWDELSLHCIKEKHGGLIYYTENMESENMDVEKKKIVEDLLRCIVILLRHRCL